MDLAQQPHKCSSEHINSLSYTQFKNRCIVCASTMDLDIIVVQCNHPSVRPSMRKIYWLTLKVRTKVSSERQQNLFWLHRRVKTNPACIYVSQHTVSTCVCFCASARRRERERKYNFQLIHEGCGYEISIHLCIYWIAATQTAWFSVHRTTETNVVGLLFMCREYMSQLK